jgi:hypothetical protein
MRIPPHVAGTLLMAGYLAGCATLFPGARPSPEQVAERGLAALERGDHVAAIPDLVWVSTHYPDRPAGRYSLLAIAAAELDPANPTGDPDAGAVLLAKFRALSDNPSWTMPVANSLRGLVLELRDARDRARMAERARQRAERVAGEATERAREVAREASRAEAQSATLGNRVGQLERELAESRRQLAEARDEVERMRRTLGN